MVYDCRDVRVIIELVIEADIIRVVSEVRRDISSVIEKRMEDVQLDVIVSNRLLIIVIIFSIYHDVNDYIELNYNIVFDIQHLINLVNY